MSKHNDEFEQEDFEFELPEPTGTAFSSRRQEGVCCDHKWVRVPLMNDKQRCSRCKAEAMFEDGKIVEYDATTTFTQVDTKPTFNEQQTRGRGDHRGVRPNQELHNRIRFTAKS